MKKLITAPAIIFRGRASTKDVAFTYRMPAGFAGDVNRTHPASIEPCAPDPTNFPTFNGQAVVIDATTRMLRYLGLVDDTALTDIYGVCVRAFPIQQMTGGLSAGFGGGAPNPTQPIDVLKSGYIMVNVNGGGVPVKGGQVFAWAKPTAGNNLAGGFGTVASGGNTIALPLNSYTWNGGPDANGVAEMIVRA